MNQLKSFFYSILEGIKNRVAGQQDSTTCNRLQQQNEEIVYKEDQADPQRDGIKLKQESKDIEKSITQTETIGDVAKTGSLVVIGSSLAGGAVTKAGLAIAGFSAKGVVAGSLAAATQSSIGNVAAGSAFALAQATAAGGALALIVPSLVLGGIAGGIFLGVKLIGYSLKGRQQDQERRTQVMESKVKRE